MGWITNISFPEGVEMNGTKIHPGMSTQVRWDIGIGEIVVNGQGKIVAESVWHGYPLYLEEKEAYQRELATWTGVFDTNMGVLFFKEGQLCHLDLSYDGVGDWIVNHSGFDWQPLVDKQRLYHTMPISAFEYGEGVLASCREKLLSNVVEIKTGYPTAHAQKRYQERSGELIDPFYKEPGPNGFIRS